MRVTCRCPGYETRRLFACIYIDFVVVSVVKRLVRIRTIGCSILILNIGIASSTRVVYIVGISGHIIVCLINAILINIIVMLIVCTT